MYVVKNSFFVMMIVKKRLDVYHEQTQPLIDYYTNAGILKTVDGTVDIDVVFQNIVEILGA